MIIFELLVLIFLVKIRTQGSWDWIDKDSFYVQFA